MIWRACFFKWEYSRRSCTPRNTRFNFDLFFFRIRKAGYSDVRRLTIRKTSRHKRRQTADDWESLEA